MNIDDRLHHIIQDVDTPCHLDLFSGYFDKRIKLQVCSTRVYITAASHSGSRSQTLPCIAPLSLFPFSFLGGFTWYFLYFLSSSPDMSLLILRQMYRTHTFSRVGPPKNVLRMYRVCVLMTFAHPRASY
jgi:hypothetical protein